jgi:quinol monooxygenase YgiN
MPLTLVRHRVRDYAAWRKVYDEFAPAQQTGGVTEQSVYQDPADPNDVLVLHRFPDRATADAFMASAELRQAMGRAGVEGEPKIELFEEAS